MASFRYSFRWSWRCSGTDGPTSRHFHVSTCSVVPHKRGRSRPTCLRPARGMKIDMSDVSLKMVFYQVYFLKYCNLKENTIILLNLGGILHFPRKAILHFKSQHLPNTGRGRQHCATSNRATLECWYTARSPSTLSIFLAVDDVAGLQQKGAVVGYSPSGSSGPKNNND